MHQCQKHPMLNISASFEGFLSHNIFFHHFVINLTWKYLYAFNFPLGWAVVWLKGIFVSSHAMNVSGSRTELCVAIVCFMRRENGKFSEKCFDAIKAHDWVRFKSAVDGVNIALLQSSLLIKESKSTSSCFQFSPYSTLNSGSLSFVKLHNCSFKNVHWQLLQRKAFSLYSLHRKPGW